MKFSEITCALEDWGLRVSDDQIHKPTGEVVQAIYLVFLQQLTGITPDALQEPANRALGIIEEFPVCCIPLSHWHRASYQTYLQELYQNSLNLNLVLCHV